MNHLRLSLSGAILLGLLASGCSNSGGDQDSSGPSAAGQAGQGQGGETSGAAGAGEGDAGQGGSAQASAGVAGSPEGIFRVSGELVGILGSSCDGSTEYTVQVLADPVSPGKNPTFRAIVWPRFSSSPSVLSGLQIVDGWTGFSCNSQPCTVLVNPSSSSGTNVDALILGDDHQPITYSSTFIGTITGSYEHTACGFHGPMLADDQPPQFSINAGPLPWSPIKVLASEGLPVGQALPVIDAGGTVTPQPIDELSLVAFWTGQPGDWTKLTGDSVQVSIPAGLTDLAGNAAPASSLQKMLLPLGAAVATPTFGPAFEGYRNETLTALAAGSDVCPQGCLRFSNSSLSYTDNKLLLAGKLVTAGKTKVKIRYQLSKQMPFLAQSTFAVVLPNGQSLDPVLLDTASQQPEEVIVSLPASGAEMVGYTLSLSASNPDNNTPPHDYDLRLLGLETL